MSKTASKLVLNKAAELNQTFSSITCNLLPKLVRHDTLEGRPHIVVPMVILCEGVHVGSGGPMFYPKDELSKTPVVWDHKPVVVYHPELNGQGISACAPDVINTRKVGIMLNTRFEKGKLKSEAWIEAPRANAVDERIMAAIEAGEMMEVSTGVFVDNEDKDGVWNGEEYATIARNYRPDHLALLPDQIGACSIKDGAGLLRNVAGPKKEQARNAIHKALVDLGLVENEMSHGNIRESLNTALRKKFNVNMDKGPYLWVEDVYDDFCIFEMGGKLSRIGYTAADTGITLSDDAPVAVVRVTEYRTVTGSFVGNKTNTEKIVMNKKKLIDGLIANSNGNLTEADRPRLEAFTEGQLEKIAFAPVANTTPAPAAAVTPPATVAPAVATVPAPVVANAAVPVVLAKAQTVQEYIAGAPKEVQEVLQNSMQLHNEEKGRLIATITTITANKANSYTKEELEGKSVNELRKLATLANANNPQPVVQPAHFAGMAPVGNAGAESGEEALAMPILNYDKKEAAKV